METMTIDELIYGLGRIKQTRNLTGNEKVILGSNYGDRCGTVQAIAVTDLETVTVDETCYSDSGYKINEEEPEEHQEGYVMLNYNEMF